MLFSSSLLKAQEASPDGFNYLKTIDGVELYYQHSVCDDGEYLLVKAVNKNENSVSLNLQPSWLSNNGTLNSSHTLTFEVGSNAEVTGDCNKPELRVSIYEFFSMYSAEANKLNLTKI